VKNNSKAIIILILRKVFFNHFTFPCFNFGVFISLILLPAEPKLLSLNFGNNNLQKKAKTLHSGFQLCVAQKNPLS